MYCDACGALMQEHQNFCRACGKPVAGVPAMPQAGRMAGHLRLVGILWLAISGLRLVGAVSMLSASSFVVRLMPPELMHFVPRLMIGFGFLFLIGAVVGFAAGWGLLEKQPWARMLAIILGALALLDPPFGTALGIYTLWVLLPAQSEEEYRRLSRAA
jgi:hypothetical protein